MTWSDGVAANATDLAWSIQQMYANYSWTAGSLLSYLRLLKGSPQQAVKALNSSVVEVVLKKPFSLLGDIIGTENTPNFTPYHIWKKWINGTKAPGNLFGTLAGAGPYYVSNFHQGDQKLVMLANNYSTPWGHPINAGHPYFNKVVTQLVPSSGSLATLLLGGQIDAAPIAPSDVAAFVNNPSFKVAATPGTGLWYIEFPQRHYPYNMSAFRHALAYAIDTNKLVGSALDGYGTVGNSAFIPASSPEFNSSVPAYSYNVTVAKNLLKGIGFKTGSDGFLTFPNGTAFQPKVYAPSEQTPIVLAGTLIVQYLQAVGINAQLRALPQATMTPLWYKGENMYLYEQNFGYPNSELLTDGSFYSYATVAGPAPGNHSIEDPKVFAGYNNTVAKLTQSTSPQQILSYEKQIQGIIANYLPSIPLFYPSFIWAYNSQHVAGWPAPPGSFEVPGAVFNMTALATISPPGAITTQSTQTTSSTSIASSSSTAGGATGVSSDTLIIAVAIVVAAVIIVAGATLMRRRPKQ
jgi:peptide/nickel transport system substrate-binding protein